MVPHIARRLRPGEFPHAFMLLVWAGFAAALLLSALGWSPLKSALAFRHHAKTIVVAPLPNSDEVYTGSIYFVPAAGAYCWERLLDNRNGDMWDKGYIDCEGVLEPPPPAKDPSGGMSGERMRAISRALRHDSD